MVSSLRLQAEMQSFGQWYRLMAEKKVVASSENGVLLELLEMTVGVPNWRVSKYCSHQGRMSDARRFSCMF